MRDRAVPSGVAMTTASPGYGGFWQSGMRLMRQREGSFAWSTANRVKIDRLEGALLHRRGGQIEPGDEDVRLRQHGVCGHMRGRKHEAVAEIDAISRPRLGGRAIDMHCEEFEIIVPRRRLRRSLRDGERGESEGEAKGSKKFQSGAPLCQPRRLWAPILAQPIRTPNPRRRPNAARGEPTDRKSSWIVRALTKRQTASAVRR